MDQPLKTPSHGGLTKTMKAAGILNTIVFKTHSTRGEANSAAKAANVPIQETMNTDGWCSDSIFAKCYDHPVRSENNLLRLSLVAPASLYFVLTHL